MLPRLLLEALLRLTEVAERRPRVRGGARNLTGAEMLGRPPTVSGGAIELRGCLLVETGGLFESHPDLIRDAVHGR